MKYILKIPQKYIIDINHKSYALHVGFNRAIEMLKELNSDVEFILDEYNPNYHQLPNKKQ